MYYNLTISYSSDLLRAIRQYQRETDTFDYALAEFLDINRTDLRCLDILTEGPLSANELARAAFLSNSALTTALDRLESKSYILRRPNAADRRGLTIQITSKFQQQLNKAFGAFSNDAIAETEFYTANEVSTLTKFFKQSSERKQRHIARIKLLAEQALKGDLHE
jgi:DNA-binding MarR family transcriptional regulator